MHRLAIDAGVTSRGRLAVDHSNRRNSRRKSKTNGENDTDDIQALHVELLNLLGK